MVQDSNGYLRSTWVFRHPAWSIAIAVGAVAVLLVAAVWFLLTYMRNSHDVTVASIAQSQRTTASLVVETMPTPVLPVTRQELEREIDSVITAMPDSPDLAPLTSAVQRNTAEVLALANTVRDEARLSKLERFYEVYCLPPGGNYNDPQSLKWMIRPEADTFARITPAIADNLRDAGGGTCTATFQFRQDFSYRVGGNVLAVWVDTKDIGQAALGGRTRGSQLWVSFGPGGNNYFEVTMSGPR